MFSPVRILCRSSVQTTKSLGTVGGVNSLYFHTEVQKGNKMSKFDLADKYRGLEKNVWVEFIQLALEHKPLNLGQGFPDDLVPDYVLNTLAEVVKEPSIFMNQYTRGFVSIYSHHIVFISKIYLSPYLLGSPQTYQRSLPALHKIVGKTVSAGS